MIHEVIDYNKAFTKAADGSKSVVIPAEWFFMYGYAIFQIEITNPEEYKPVRQIRLDNSVGNVIIIKGV